MIGAIQAISKSITVVAALVTKYGNMNENK
jgi:hypothetical protein